jgi:putative intracellular protease/amidase
MKFKLSSVAAACLGTVLLLGQDRLKGVNAGSFMVSWHDAIEGVANFSRRRELDEENVTSTSITAPSSSEDMMAELIPTQVQ